MVDDEDSGTRADPGAPTADGTALPPSKLEASSHLPSGLEETIVPSWGGSVFAALPDPGYQIGELIGRGGMGEVVAAHDQRIGREVAVKRLRSLEPSEDLVSRFLREARIQARLDHPAIVPVYELGLDGERRPYFTMKRLAGVTLAKRLSQGSPVQPMLRAFVDVCLAIQLAHSRGVVHRDLKPSNIMLGDYGEVYVLDWGVARVLTETKRTTGPAMTVEADDGTTAGAILGTPGYMAPEQVRGHEAGTKADVYALGAILFEILTGEALHPRGEAALGSTLTSPQEAPTRRVAELRTIPPELDSVCFDALAEEAQERPTARELADRVQAYLDGDRDVERRRAMAAAQLAAAREALASSAPDGRATAMRRAGRALALDPDSTEAASLVTTLLLEPPDARHLPPDLGATLDAEERELNKGRSRQGMWAYLSLFLFWAVIPFLDIKSWTVLLSFYGCIAIGAGVALRNSFRGNVTLPTTMVVLGLVCVMFTRMSGPFILTPIVICAALMQLTSMSAVAERLWLVVGWTLAVVLLPFVLEWTDVLPRTYGVTGGVVVSASDVFDMRGSLDETVLFAANLFFLVATAFVGTFLARRWSRAQRQIQIQAWHLRQLLPEEKKPWQTKPG
jgi:serine/threonine-protein kinase